MRGVAPFAPLAIALLMSRAVLPGGEPREPGTPNEVDAVKCDDIEGFQDCHTRFPTGCSAAGRYDAYLNVLKNQLVPPTTQPIAFHQTLQAFQDLDARLPDELTRSNHADLKTELAALGEGQIVGIVGFLYYAQPTGAESSNCQLAADDDEKSNVDFHIGIGFDSATAQSLLTRAARVTKKTLQQESVVVEMTPHYRFEFEDTWTLTNLKAVIGKKVRVAGQLLVDSEHNIPSQNCAIATTAKQRQSCWRGSAWELHPVTRFEVCDTDACTATSNDWRPLPEAGTR